MATFYQAVLVHRGELYIDNDFEKGCDPDSGWDSGVIDKIKAKTITELKEKLNSYAKGWEHFEENRYDTGYDEIDRDGVKVYHMLSAFIERVTVESIDVTLDNQIVGE